MTMIYISGLLVLVCLIQQIRINRIEKSAKIHNEGLALLTTHLTGYIPLKKKRDEVILGFIEHQVIINNLIIQQFDILKGQG